MHPVIRSIALHFWLAYDHPFVDGNGRTARALLYWSMLRQGYWAFAYISVSRIILEGPSRYSRAFIYSETDDNDLTYFLLYHLDVIQRALQGLREYIAQKVEETRAVDHLLSASVTLNHRQRALLAHAIRHPGAHYTMKSHQTSHGVSYQTAHNDLFRLEERGLLSVSRIGRTYQFSPVKDIQDKLASLTA